MAQRLVVIGAGMASGRMLEHLVEDAPGAFDITLFGAEPRVNYNRIMLSPVLSGEKTFDEIVTHDAAWYDAQGIACRFGDAVTRIDRDAKVVHSASGATALRQAGDRHRLGSLHHSGARQGPSGRDDLPRSRRRRRDDRRRGKPGAKAVVIGGGLLGLEAAAGLKARGMEVTVLHLMPT